MRKNKVKVIKIDVYYDLVIANLKCLITNHLLTTSLIGSMTR